MQATLIGATINSARRGMGWTLQTLADRVGLSAAYLSDIERGARTPPAHTVRAICNAFMDADSAEWFWLWLQDLIGAPSVLAMQTYARRMSQEPGSSGTGGIDRS